MTKKKITEDAEKVVGCKCLFLLAKAKEIFGADLVTEAYVTMTLCGAEPETRRRVGSELLAVASRDGWGEGDNLDYDCTTILLVFCNGRALRFTNSEWASISLFSSLDRPKAIEEID